MTAERRVNLANEAVQIEIVRCVELHALPDFESAEA
jgi:hypothetical protein